ncbi:MAG: class IV adenylate cyclase [Chloroflexota bacterium]|nr:class IV adenylate cyclase [Chloroflexota bacterium]
MAMEDMEREIKFYIQDLEAVEERLQLCGSELVRPRILELNLRLDTGENTLMKTGRMLRIRKDDRIRITYKANARIEDGVIARTEIEFTADDFGKARRLFEGLGYRVVVTYEKYRREYQLGDVTVMLDELPFGDFMEIEAPNNTLIEGIALVLGLDWSRGINTNYLGLMQIVKANLGLAFDDLTFDNFQGLDISPVDLNVEPADA